MFCTFIWKKKSINLKYVQLCFRRLFFSTMWQPEVTWINIILIADVPTQPVLLITHIYVYCLSLCSVTAWHVSDLKLFVLPPIDPWCVVSALCLWFDSICTVDEETSPTVRFSGFGERDFVCTHRKQLLFFSLLLSLLNLPTTVQKCRWGTTPERRCSTKQYLQQQTLDWLQLLCVWGSLHSPANSKLYYNL